jgi:hypothetical protein
MRATSSRVIVSSEELRKERERNNWWTFITSPIYGEGQETEEQKQRRETERLQRLASKSIKNQLAQREAVFPSYSTII